MDMSRFQAVLFKIPEMMTILNSQTSIEKVIGLRTGDKDAVKV